jgi:hypothetical protein
MIDVSKIRVGDEVTLSGRVERTDAGICKPFAIDIQSVLICVGEGAIATHTPKPRDFKPGDLVCELGIEPGFRIVHVRDGQAWIDNAEGWNKIAKLIHLRHADESE